MVNGRLPFLGLSQSAKALSIQLCQVCTNQIRRPIAVFMAKSIESVVSDLGIIYSGNAYMNLDVKTPLQRIKNILDLVDPLCIITDTAHQQALNTVWPAEKTLLINPDLSLLTAENEDALYENLEQLIDTDPLCLMNTSGSTGTPKKRNFKSQKFYRFHGMGNFHNRYWRERDCRAAFLPLCLIFIVLSCAC